MANLRVDKITSTETFETTGSVQFDGTGDYLTIPSNADLNPASGDFTLEMWIYPSSYNPSNVESGYNTLYVNAATNGLWIGTYQGSFIVRKYGVANVITYSSTPTVNEWTHVAITRKGSSLRLFYDGVLQASVIDSTAFVTAATNIGYDGSSVHWHGFISNLRFIKGKALYTSNFKTPMKELEVTPETKLLCCQSKTNTILEKTGKTITANGNAIANELTPGLLTPVPKAGGSSAITGSVEFDGTGDYLTVPNTEDLRLADSDFTIEFWATTSKTDSSYTAFSLFENSSAIRSYILEVRNNGAVRFEWWYNGSSSNNITTGTGAVIVNEWYHYAVSRNGATLKLFINGLEVGSTNVGTNSLYNNTVTPFMIGGMFQSGAHTQKWQGNISNLRVVKGTALYTEEFIPPTRELKKVPGTVLLCCQDPDSPLTEAIGKTITGYGSLQQDSPELVTDGEFESASNWSSAASDWTVGSGQAVINSSDSGYDYLGQLATGLLNGEQYELVFSVTNYSTGRLELAQSSAGNIGVESPNGRNVFRFTYTGTAGGAVSLYSYTANTASFTLTNVSLKRVFASKSGSNFTPQVGDDRKVTFEGVTKVNSDAYFYLPTGDTASREATGSYSAGTRGLFSSGNSPGMTNKAIDYITIASTGDALDFGDLSVNSALQEGGCASHVRGLFTGLITPARTSNIEYVTISSTNDTNDFGDLTRSDSNPSALSNSTRGVFFGGATLGPTTYKDIIDYVTISSTGDAQDFGDMIIASYVGAGAASPTRGILAGGYNGSSINSIEYVTISSTGNAKDFGDLLNANSAMAGASNAIRAVFAGGETPTVVNTIQYLTISTTGNTFDFGDLPAARRSCGGASSSTRMVIAGGFESPSQTTEMEYVNIATTSNTFDFGDLVYSRMNIGGLSNGHGGLG